MINRCGLIRKKADMSMEEFRDFWFYNHGPIGASMKNLKHYAQHLVLDRQQRLPAPRVDYEMDGYSELWFDDIRDMEEGVASLKGAGTADLANFTEETRLLVFVKRFVTPLPEELKGQKLVKYVAFIGRGEGVSAERFHRCWLEKYAEAAKALPGVAACAQNIVIDRLVAGQHAAYEAVPVEGMEELWFRSMEDLERCFASEEFAAAQELAKGFAGPVSTYLFETAKYPVPGIVEEE